MTDETASPTGKRPRSREQLLRLLHDDPRSVSRAEIKAAFADGRLGDQDLDIPVLAGMKRITELLAELDPNAEVPVPLGPESSGHLRETSRASTTSGRIQDIDTQLGHVADRLAALETRIQKESVAAEARATADERSAQATARTVRIVVIVLVIVAVVVALQLGLRIANV